MAPPVSGLSSLVRICGAVCLLLLLLSAAQCQEDGDKATEKTDSGQEVAKSQPQPQPQPQPPESGRNGSSSSPARPPRPQQPRGPQNGPLRPIHNIPKLRKNLPRKAPTASPSSNGMPLCDLYPKDGEMHARVKRLVSQGAQLLKYQLSFPEYSENPLRVNMSQHFKADHWQRVFSPHGQSLLSLAFNYDVLSMQMLTFGVEDVEVEVVDSPKGCFGRLTEQQKEHVVLVLLIHDFLVEVEDDELWLDEDDYLCHEMIKDDGDGYAKFVHKCCTKTKETRVLKCTVEISDTVKGLYIMLTILKVAFLLFGPLFLQKWFYKDSIKKAGYVVPLKEKLTKTLLLKKIRYEDNSTLTSMSNRKEMKQFRRFRQLVKNIPSDEIVPVTFKKLHVLVDHKELISEKNVPVGLINFIYENILRCGVIKHEPFASCCAESIFGSWSKRFLWFKLMDGSDCNRSCKKFCSWAHIFRFLGGLFLLCLVPLPYIIRTIIFYIFEEDEIMERKDAVEEIGLDLKYGYNLYQYISPTHAAFIGMYIAYIASFALLFTFKKANPLKYDKIVRGAIQDLRNVSYVESFRMLFAHLLLPFEKFGALCGFLVAALYWPFALPFCIITVVFYCIPTLYLSGRFLITERPSCLKEKPLPTPRSKSKNKKALISKGTSSFETCLLLDSISPSPHQVPQSPEKKPTKRSTFSCHKHEICAAFSSLLIGLLCIINMLVLLAMYAEVIGFVAEVAVLTLMGAIVNAGSAAKFVMLAFWVVLYTTTCYNQAYGMYDKLNKKVFAYIKDKLGEDIETVTILPEEEQQHTAFKYFTTTELREYIAKIREHSLPIDFDPPARPCHKVKIQKSSSDPLASEDVIADKEGRLYWNIKSLIMFVDNEDVPRIPKQLFFDICEQELPGCPGPVYKSIMKATKRLLYMVVFLAFVFIVVISFGNIYNVSNTNQMLLTLASGFLPFVVRFVLMPKEIDLELNTYSFHGKIHQLIFKYSQPWPVFDLSFEMASAQREERPDDPDGDGSGPDSSRPQGGARRRVTAESHHMINPPDIVDPTHVDLLITVRDEEEDENLRSEPGSLGSNRSINSGTRHNPDDGPHAGGSGINPVSSSGAIGSAANNPTNAFLQNASRAASQSPLEPPVQQSPGSHQNIPPKTSPVAPTASSASAAGAAAAAAPAAPSEPSQTPTGKRVDLVVDLAKGGVQVRGAEGERAESAANGIPMWPMSSPYKKISDKDSEAAV